MCVAIVMESRMHRNTKMAEGSNGVTFRRSTAALLALLLSASVALADWPTNPQTPLLVGNVSSLGAGDTLACVATPDGATWVAWVDGQCFGVLRLQRISPGGTLLMPGPLSLFADDGCTSREPRLAACTDGSIVVSAVDGSQNGGGGPLIDSRLQRVASDGQALWGKGLILPGGSGKVGQLLGLSDGDVLVAWNQGATVLAARFNAAGAPVWAVPATITSPTGSSMRIFALVSDGADGAFIFWDVPGPYTRAILAARVTASGSPAWTQPLIVTPPVPASSRHTDPIAIAGAGGEAIVAWTEGAESSDTIVAIRCQRISPAGQMLLEPEGRRVSLAATRQFDVRVSRNPGNRDLYVAWRDGWMPQALRGQRLSAAGDRLWGDTGVLITAVASVVGSHFDATWNANRLAMSVVDVPAGPADPRVHIHRVDFTGTVHDGPWPVSGETTGRAVHVGAAAAESNALIVTWFNDPPGFADSVAAQRINSDGSLGVHPGDATGDGAIDINDLLAVVVHWGLCPSPFVSCTGDIDPSPDGNGDVDVNDLLKVITNWGQ